MQRKILNKKFFIKTADGKAYCSKCGQIIMQDQRNMKIHAERCGFGTHDFIKIFKEGDYAVAWKEMGDKLGFIVYEPQLVSNSGLPGQFLGGRWSEVYKCVFSLVEKKIWEDSNSSYDLEFWINQNLECLNAESSSEILKRAFHIPAIKDLKTFVEIYKGKGFEYKALLTDEEARRLLEHDVNIVETSNELKPVLMNDGTVSVEVIELNNSDELVLRLDVFLERENQSYQILISDNYFFSNQPLDVREILKCHLRCNVDSEKLLQFAERYPRFGLMNYWKNSNRNLLIPLLCADYDPRLELLSKSGCTALANHFYRHKEFHSGKLEQRSDIKKWLGVPVKVLRRVQEDAFKENDLLSVLSCVYHVAPEYLHNLDITHHYVRFLKNNILALAKGKVAEIRLFPYLDSKTCLKIARYISELEPDRRYYYTHYDLYVHYMNLSIGCEEYLMGYTPDDLIEAHRRALLLQDNILTKEQEKRFKEQVVSESYISLETEGKDACLFEESPYFIRAPKRSRELIREGSDMHHCVASYIQPVMEGDTKIYFLRRKVDPDAVFATIEVLDNQVNQVKAKRNGKTAEDVQAFVKYWASVKQLDINTRDIA